MVKIELNIFYHYHYKEEAIKCKIFFKWNFSHIFFSNCPDLDQKLFEFDDIPESFFF